MPVIYYIQTSAIGLCINLIIALHMLAHREQKSHARAYFWALLFSNMILLVLEMLLNIYTGNDAPITTIILNVIVALFYTMNPVPEALWVLYLDSIIRQNTRRSSRWLLIAVCIPLVVNMLFAVTSPFTHILFVIDDNNVYSRGPYFGMMLLCCYCYLVYCLLMVVIKRNELQSNELMVALFAALLPVVAGTLQSLFYGMSLIWISLSFSLLIAYINLQNEQVYRELKTLDRMKNEFLANTSHELRTPLHGIINMTQSVLEHSDDRLEREQRQHLQIVVSSAKRLTNLINDILDISSMRSGAISLQLAPVHLHTVADTILSVMERLKHDPDIVLLNTIPPNLPYIDADIERMQQILYNLVDNALKFTDHGQIELGAEAGSGQIKVWVQDTGRGIPAAHLHTIFHPFYQIDGGMNRERGGTGLGLAITQNLIALHGGTIEVSSVEGQGSRFLFTLPIHAGQQRLPVKSAQTNHLLLTADSFEDRSIGGLEFTSQAKPGSYKILAVDDDATGLRALFHILDRAGYEMKAVSSGAAALEQLTPHHPYDLVILDVMMPKVSGYDVLKHIRAQFALVDLPVLLLTAKTRMDDMLQGFAAGANDYLHKPFTTEELKARVYTLAQLKGLVRARLESELSFLQAQIKPHFLFNSLSVITALSIREPHHTQRLLYDLADYLRGRFQFEHTNGFTSLSSELATIRAYVSIEQARFRDTLHVQIEAESLPELSIPMLLIQPLVENAIRHGIAPKPGGGTVTLRVRSAPQATEIQIIDDGIGMSEQQLQSAWHKREKGSGIGLYNIQRRLFLYYGRGLDIQSVEGKGTTISMIIPHMEG
ncbi:ATP-binding protein [Paenibacillus campi]|uniref:ATP-binding response regulator n=1 Tax=Paenibacillus campi TaxID=3106031 RepID=UPI002AFEE8AB|nr:ATP-binding protein [Paenibacillus sp. SGZ-1014]